MLRSTPALTALLILPIMAGLLQFGPFGHVSQLAAGGSGSIQPDVLEALETEPETRVIIHLKHPDPEQGGSMAALIENTAQRQAAVLASLDPAHFTLTHQYELAPALAGSITAEGIAQLDGHPDVLTVSIDPPVFAALDDSIPLIGADDPEFETLGLDGSGVVVAVIDSGIDTDHPALADSIVGQQCFLTTARCPDDPESPYYSPGNPAEDDNIVDPYHGTHVSGIITSNGAGVPAGVAPAAGIYAYKVLNWFGQGYFSDVLLALQDIPSLGPNLRPDLVNMSLWDGVAYPPGTCPVDVLPTFTPALETLRDLGITSFASAGNNGSKLARLPPAGHVGRRRL
jgi:subtilisin family serine protease